MGLYDEQIELLQLLIENWYDIKTREDFYKVFGENVDGFPEHNYGLCVVCHLESLPLTVNNEIFKDWMYFNGDYDYPVDGVDEFVEMRLITGNPKRLHLAVHCLQLLRQRNKINEESKVNKRCRDR